MFDSVYSAIVTPAQFFLMAGSALAAGLLFAWIMSFRVRSSNRFFFVTAILPFVVAAVITFVNGNIGAGVVIGGAFGLIRFRSAQGSSDELASILIAMGSGIAFGMGYIGYGVTILLGMAVIYSLVSLLPLFEHRERSPEMMLKVTIPESLDYTDVFDDSFAHYCQSVRKAGVKTTGMGSLFRLSFRIRLKDTAEEKAFLDELRTKNGNLEIQLLPYTENTPQL